MTRNKLIEQLLIRAKELNDELRAVQSLINLYENTGEVVAETIMSYEAISAISPEGQGNDFKAKGSMSWEDYALYLLDIKQNAKASEIIQMATIANPRLGKKTVESAIRSKLSKLYRDGRIGAEVAANKKEGYTYKIKKEPIGS